MRGTPNAEEKSSLQGTEALAKNSHPIAPSNCTVRVGSLDACGTDGPTLNHLATLGGDGTWLASCRGILRSWDAGSGSIRTCWVTTTRLFLLVLRRGLIAGGLRDGLSVLLIFVDGPVEDIIVLEALADEEIAEDLSQVRIVGFVVEAERTRVIEIDGKLVREAATQDLGRSRHLFLHDAVILLLLRSGLQTLPREGATAEVKHDVAQGFHIVTARLLWIGCKHGALSDEGDSGTYRLPSGC